MGIYYGKIAGYLMIAGFMAEPSSKKRFVKHMFDDISGDYDLMNRVISFGLDGILRKRTVSCHAKDKLVLDICSGTGDMSVDLKKQPGFNGMIILGDFSPHMHKLARRKLNNNGNVFYIYCDAEILPFKDGVFDGVINGYSLRNLGDLKAFGSEICRVLQPEGQVSIVDVAHPPNKIIAWLFYLYFYKLLPLVSKLFTRKKYAYRYLPVSLRIFLKQPDVLASLSNAGFKGYYENMICGAAAIYRLKKIK
jgi:demethylmenaquinone methyltransferase/2-methoxy-6-polyprenyl-1,4-benzoquinol methylase